MAGTSTNDAKAVAYVCVEDITHPDGVDEAGRKYTGPAMSVGWLLEGGHIVKAGTTAAKKAAKDAESRAQANAEDGEGK
jgi:hypothetical protein